MECQGSAAILKVSGHNLSCIPPLVILGWAEDVWAPNQMVTTKSAWPQPAARTIFSRVSPWSRLTKKSSAGFLGRCHSSSHVWYNVKLCVASLLVGSAQEETIRAKVLPIAPWIDECLLRTKHGSSSIASFIILVMAFAVRGTFNKKPPESGNNWIALSFSTTLKTKLLLLNNPGSAVHDQGISRLENKASAKYLNHRGKRENISEKKWLL